MSGRSGFLSARADASSVLFMGLIAVLAQLTGVGLLLFPELGALSNDILKRPHGAWASTPLLLVATPLATGIIGIAFASRMEFGVMAVLLDVGASVLVIHLLRSPIAPAISAGLLPLVLGVHSVVYPLAITVGTGLLALLSVLQRRFGISASPRTVRDAVDDLMERPPAGTRWWPPFALALLLVAGLAQWSGLHFLLFPPLVVIGFEMFAHPAVCPWAARPWRLPLACLVSAAAGVAAVTWLGSGALAAMVAMIAGIVGLRLLDLHAPPVLAVGLLPLVMPHPDGRFVGAVLAGTLLVTTVFELWRWMITGIRRPGF
ncbi:MAG: hypothetical protein KGK06_09040 [Xanthomonadaceae bacterium]|nr:hypothetical protein [Xanthomonadaceae bacterium]MDE2278158.1 hypothetical protein [Xanthomonadaceae bacterium]MDE2316534.1 hypothetical protein [Xanthomonadaceae bacterium]